MSMSYRKNIKVLLENTFYGQPQPTATPVQSVPYNEDPPQVHQNANSVQELSTILISMEDFIESALDGMHMQADVNEQLNQIIQYAEELKNHVTPTQQPVDAPPEGGIQQPNANIFDPQLNTLQTQTPIMENEEEVHDVESISGDKLDKLVHMLEEILPILKNKLNPQQQDTI